MSLIIQEKNLDMVISSSQHNRHCYYSQLWKQSRSIFTNEEINKIEEFGVGTVLSMVRWIKLKVQYIIVIIRNCFNNFLTRSLKLYYVYLLQSALYFRVKCPRKTA